MQSGVKTLSAGGGASLCCLLLLWLIYSHLLREGKDTCLLITLSAELVSVCVYDSTVCDPEREEEKTTP